jgi:hypothetical protein
MKITTLEKMQIDSTLSEMDRMAAGFLIESKKQNGHRDLPAAAAKLQECYKNRHSLSWDDALELVTDVATEAYNREWTG